MELPKVLLIDDDPAWKAELSGYLASNGFDSAAFASFPALLEFLQNSRGPFVVVPELRVGSRHLFDSISLIKNASDRSILVLSDHGEETEKIVALELGADDFMPKTIDRREILARIRAAARRLLACRAGARQPGAGTQPGATEPVGSWHFLRDKRELIDPEGRPVRLTTAEFSLLDAFVENIGRPLSRDYLSTIALGRHYSVSDRSIDNLVAKLRRKLREPAKLARMIKTARPVGYVFTGFSASAEDSQSNSITADSQTNKK